MNIKYNLYTIKVLNISCQKVFRSSYTYQLSGSICYTDGNWGGIKIWNFSCLFLKNLTKLKQNVKKQQIFNIYEIENFCGPYNFSY